MFDYLSVWAFSFLSQSFWLSEKPCLPLLKELGPADVGVSLPMFFILIFASGGISSGSLSSSSLKTDTSFFGGSDGTVSLGFVAPSLIEMGLDFIAILLPMLKPILEVLQGAGWSVEDWSSSSGVRCWDVRLTAVPSLPPVLQETGLVFTLSSSSCGPAWGKTTHQGEQLFCGILESSKLQFMFFYTKNSTHKSWTSLLREVTVKIKFVPRMKTRIRANKSVDISN